MIGVPPFPPLRGTAPRIAIVRDLAIFAHPNGWSFDLPGGSDNLVYLKIELVSDADGSGINQAAARNDYPINQEGYSFAPYLGFVSWDGTITGDNAFDLLNVLSQTEIDSGPPPNGIGYPLPCFIPPFEIHRPGIDMLLNGIKSVFLMMPGDGYLQGLTYLFWAQQLFNPFQQQAQQAVTTIDPVTNIAGIPYVENR